MRNQFSINNCVTVKIKSHFLEIQKKPTYFLKKNNKIPQKKINQKNSFALAYFLKVIKSFFGKI